MPEIQRIKSSRSNSFSRNVKDRELNSSCVLFVINLLNLFMVVLPFIVLYHIDAQVHGNPISVSRSASFASDEVPFTSFSAPLSRSPPPHRRPPIAPPPLSSSQFVSVSNVPASQYSIQPTSAIARGGSVSSFPFR